jgi:hypothetical protein
LENPDGQDRVHQVRVFYLASMKRSRRCHFCWLKAISEYLFRASYENWELTSSEGFSPNNVSSIFR